MMDVKKCRITHYPSPVLGKRAEPVEKIDENIALLAERMIEIMVETKGVGLAGPQAGVGLRIFVASPDGSKEGAKVYINPEISPSGPTEVNQEGCLSLPGIYGNIARCKKCTIKATGLDGKKFTEEAVGLLARIFQHEYDHLEGRLVADRLSTVARISARKKLKKLRQKHAEQSD